MIITELMFPHEKDNIIKHTIIPRNITESNAPLSTDEGLRLPDELVKTGITNETDDTSTESDDNAQPQTETISENSESDHVQSHHVQ